MSLLDVLPPERRCSFIERAAENPELVWALVIATIALAASLACAIAYRRRALTA